MDIVSSYVTEKVGHNLHNTCICYDPSTSETATRAFAVSHLEGDHSTYEVRQLFSSASPEMVELRR